MTELIELSNDDQISIETIRHLVGNDTICIKRELMPNDIDIKPQFKLILCDHNQSPTFRECIFRNISLCDINLMEDSINCSENGNDEILNIEI